MADAGVASTLSELERKLRELEDELQAPTPPPAATLPTIEPPAPASGDAGSAHAQLDELLELRGELERSVQQLMSEFDRVLASLRSTVPAQGAANPPAAPPPIAPAPRGSAPPALAVDLDAAVMDGAITVDAGPFADIGLLSGFEQALGGVPGVRDVYVRGFEGRRAMIDVTLSQPVALGSELRRSSPVSFSIIAADAGRLSVAVEAER